MTAETRQIPNTALAIFPSVKGFGWMVFDGPLSPAFRGVCTLADKPATSADKNARCLARINAILSEYRPATVVLEAFEGPRTRRHARIQSLCRSIISAAVVDGIPVRIVSRAEIAACLGDTRPKTRYAVATLVARYLKEIRHRLPKKRRAWDTEPSDMALFNAAALLFVHYSNPAGPR